jgi:Fic family protein
LRYFVPHPLPPSNPPFQFNAEIMTLYGEASFSLGKLNEMAQRLPDPKRFIKAYVIKEALLSSAIEGIHTTLLDVFKEALTESKPNKETQLVLNYTKSLDIALSMIKDEGLPLVSRVILSAHKALMSLGEGDKATPGQYRKQSVRVGELIPPPAPHIPELMADLEKYIQQDSGLPPLIKAGLAHVQFETIHPFLDGNGRIGRLLIVLMLIDGGLLQIPILYPSYYFKKHHLEYYQRLDRVRTQGDFEGWIAYYLRAIRDSSLDAHRRAKEIEHLENDLKALIQTDPKFSKMRETALSGLNILFQMPIMGIKEMSLGIGKAYNTAHNIIMHFMDLGIVSENKEQKRNKLYRFDPYLKLLEKEYF